MSRFSCIESNRRRRDIAHRGERATTLGTGTSCRRRFIIVIVIIITITSLSTFSSLWGHHISLLLVSGWRSSDSEMWSRGPTSTKPQATRNSTLRFVAVVNRAQMDARRSFSRATVVPGIWIQPSYTMFDSRSRVEEREKQRRRYREREKREREIKTARCSIVHAHVLRTSTIRRVWRYIKVYICVHAYLAGSDDYTTYYMYGRRSTWATYLFVLRQDKWRRAKLPPRYTSVSRMGSAG